MTSRLATHTFEIRPSPTTIDGKGHPPDEMMIDWGRIPHGSEASIYLPAIAAADVLALADKMYATHRLVASDAHTIQCATGGIGYIPIPKGSGADLAGLFSIELPLGIRRGQKYEVVVRQVTNVPRIADERATSKLVDGPRGWRRVHGSFQLTIPVSIKGEMLVPEERTLSVMRWIQEAVPRSNRWYPVLLRYVDQLAGRVAGLGGDPSTVPPTGTGIWPGLGGHGHHGPHGGPPSHPTQIHAHGSKFCGKIHGVVFNHFGRFEAFILETREGEIRRFREPRGAHSPGRAARLDPPHLRLRRRAPPSPRVPTRGIILHGPPPEVGE